MLANWVQEEERDGYGEEQERPLDPAGLTTETIRDYCDWLAAERAWSTTRTYMAGILSYLSHLEAEGLLPDAVSVSHIRAYVRQRAQRARRPALHATTCSSTAGEGRVDKTMALG